MKQTTIAQLSDLHLTPKHEKAFGIDVRKNFMDIYESLLQERKHLDALVITGDICYQEGAETIYQWAKQFLDALRIPYYLIPGNHDDTHSLHKSFNLPPQHITNGEIYYEVEFPVGKAFFLDTSDDKISVNQLQWLQQKLHSVHKQCFIFMHHPPVYAGITYMDTQCPLINKDQLEELLYSFRNIQFVVCCGHFHAEKTILDRNILTMIAPTGFFHIDQDSESFRIDHYKAGWRKIVWMEEYMNTVTQYIN